MDASLFPIVLIDRPAAMVDRSWKALGRADDIALSYYQRVGFEGDRVRKNLYGYPGLLRDLSNPPPWINVEPEDLEGQPSKETSLELRPLIQQANETAAETLVSTFLSERRHARAVAEGFLGVDTSPAQGLVDEASATAFRDLVALAKVLGVETFDRIFEVVFDLDLGDEFTPVVGTPDLLIWHPTLTPAVWFFSEVKAPGDYLSEAQKQWLQFHWDVVKDHFLITMLA